MILVYSNTQWLIATMFGDDPIGFLAVGKQESKAMRAHRARDAIATPGQASVSVTSGDGSGEDPAVRTTNYPCPEVFDCPVGRCDGRTVLASFCADVPLLGLEGDLQTRQRDIVEPFHGTSWLSSEADSAPSIDADTSPSFS